MDWCLILQWGFLIALLTSAIRLSVPVLLVVLGEIITERSGVLNLGLEGIMIIGGVAGFMTAYFLETGPMADASGYLYSWIALLAGVIAGIIMSVIMSVLSISLKADQTISGVTLVVFGVGLANYLYSAKLLYPCCQHQGYASGTNSGAQQDPGPG
jgi:simple sugar transport system permease protein